jgi:hypothetical protein
MATLPIGNYNPLAINIPHLLIVWKLTYLRDAAFGTGSRNEVELIQPGSGFTIARGPVVSAG